MEDSGQLRIISDGTGEATIVTLGDGTVVPNVYSAVITLEANEINKVDLVINVPSVDVHASLNTTSLFCQICSGSFEHACEIPF